MQQETRTIPVVFVNVSDPIGAGFIASLARPGGNFTGVLHYEVGILGKWLAMLKEIAPSVARAAAGGGPEESRLSTISCGQPRRRRNRSRSKLCPLRSRALLILSAQSNSFARMPNGGLILPPDVTTITHRDLVLALAARHRLPAVYPFRLFVAAGGLMSYGTDQIDMFGQTASYIDRILRGAKPADLPVQTPTKYETTLNLKTAKALGLTVPPGLIVAADEVIE